MTQVEVMTLIIGVFTVIVVVAGVLWIGAERGVWEWTARGTLAFKVIPKEQRPARALVKTELVQISPSDDKAA